jgi:hypothetical protein
MHPRRDAIGCRPDLPITSDGPVECRLFGPAAVVDPRSDAGGRLVPDAATDLGFVQALQDYLQGRRGQRSKHEASVSRVNGRLSIVPGATRGPNFGGSAPMSQRRQILYFVLKHALLVIEEVAQRVVN